MRNCSRFLYGAYSTSHSEHEQLIGRQKVTLQRAIPHGRHKATVELNMSPSTAWSYLKLLEANNTIDIKSNNKFSVVTVVNWGYIKQRITNLTANLTTFMTTKKQQIDNK